MRTNDQNEEVPATWGEAYDLYVELAGGSKDNAAVELIEREIKRAVHGRDDLITVPDHSLRNLLMPMLKQPRETPVPEEDE